jgi:hypothetical protein
MKKENIYRYYTELPQWAKGTVVVVSVGAVGFVGYRLYKKLFPSQSEKQSQQFLNNIKADILNFKSQGQVPSYPETQYSVLANSAYESMRYCVGDSYGTAEEVMKKMQNNLDVALLIDAFDMRQNYCYGIPTGLPLDLIAFLKKELGNDWFGLTDYRVVRINENWTKKGITYRI